MPDRLPWQRPPAPEVVRADDLKAREVREAAKRVRLGDPVDAVARALKTSPVELAKAMNMLDEPARDSKGPLSEAELELAKHLRKHGASLQLLARLFKQGEETMRSNLSKMGFCQRDP